MVYSIVDIIPLPLCWLHKIYIVPDLELEPKPLVGPVLGANVVEKVGPLRMPVDDETVGGMAGSALPPLAGFVSKFVTIAPSG